MFVGGNGPRLNQELVYSNETHDVPTWDIFYWLHVAAHHQNGPGRKITKCKKRSQTFCFSEKRKIKTSLDPVVFLLPSLVSYRQDSPLDGFDEEVLLLAWDVVWSHDTHLLARAHTAREHAAKGVETTFVGGWNHL